MLDLWLCHAGGWPDIGTQRIDRHFAPAHQSLSFLGNDLVDDFPALFSFLGDLWQKYITDCILAGFWQLGVQLVPGYLLEEAVGQPHEDTRAVAGVGFESATAAVVHAGIQVVGVQHNLVAGNTLDIGDKPHATGVFLVGGVVKSNFIG